MAKEHKKLYKAGKNWIVATLTATTITLLGGIGAYTVHADTTAENNQSTETSNISQSSQSDNSSNSVVLTQPVTTQSNSTVKNSQPVQNTPTTLTVTAATNTLDNQGQQIESQNSANENIGSAVSLTETSTDNLSNNDNSSLWYHPNLTGFDEYDIAKSGCGDSDISIQDPTQPSITVYYSFFDFSENPAISQYAHKSVTRTIYLQNPQTGVESVGGQAQVNFNRWIAIDSDYDNQLVGAGPWIRSLESSASLPQYNIPQINGYTSYCNGVKTERIKAENNVIGDQPDEIYHITYKPNVESVTRTIIITKPDGDSSSVIQNVEMGSSDYIWPEYLIPQYDGYDSYVDNQKTTNIPAQIAGSNSVTVTVTYQEKSGNPTTNEQHKTITRTIDIYELNGHIDIVTQSVSFTRSVLNDKDDETSYSNWTADGNSYWDEYIIPQHAGYKSQCNLQDTRIIPRQYVNSNDQNTILSVSYVKSNNNSGIDNNVTGWRISSDGNHYVYYKDNQPLAGRRYVSLPTINGVGTSWYLVDNGVVQSGVQKWAGSYYYFDPVTYLKVTNDYRQSQWGDWYLFGNDGRILTGVQKWAGSYYYFDPVTYLKVTNDYRQSQWGDWYLFGNDGRILTGVQKWAGSYYYFDPVTYLKVTNSYRQSQWGDWYMFGPDGRIVSGLYNWLGNLYYFDPVTYLKVTNQYVYVGGVRYWADANGCLSRA
ncbi:KxYKxGKxW signal peptide domain-containing protein [Limosilactobacillus reuteri subsp. suis]|uniref:KxYKxGKxW signal peptide domain-containing protein n=1 Tax=Limosilactobacillus reuteri TaxID=1598 RepID=UPI00399225D7